MTGFSTPGRGVGVDSVTYGSVRVSADPVFTKQTRCQYKLIYS